MTANLRVMGTAYNLCVPTEGVRVPKLLRDSTRAATVTWSDTTRYLCAAAYTNEVFARRVVDELLGERLQAVAPSVGVELRTIVLHCLDALHQHRRRNAVLTVALLMAVVFSPVWTIAMGLLIFPVGVMVAAGARSGRLRDFILNAVQVALAIVTLIVPLIVFILDASGESPETSVLFSWPVGIPWLSFVFWLVMFVLVVRARRATRKILVSKFRRDNFRPDLAPEPEVPDWWAEPGVPDWRADRLAQIEKAGQGNVTIYGGFTPFIGYGAQIQGWSFAVPILAKSRSEGAEVIQFDALELIDHVRSNLSAAGRADSNVSSSGSAGRLDALILEDRVFVSGRELVGDERLLPQRDQAPRQNLPPEEIRELAAHPRDTCRYYLCAHALSWGGEIVVSTFLHFSTEGKTLYLQCNRSMLGPLRRQYREMDRLSSKPTMRESIQVLASSASSLASTVFLAPRYLLLDIRSERRYEKRHEDARELALDDLNFNYGAYFGIRESEVDANYHNYFQMVDANKHLKIVERHVLAEILNFLDDHGVDTTAFREQQTTILNQGIIQTGGVSLVGSQAVGAGAQSIQQNTMKAQAGGG